MSNKNSTPDLLTPPGTLALRVHEAAVPPIILALRAPQAARAIGISPRLLATLTAQRRVPFVRINTVVVYPVPELQRWLSEEVAKEGKP